MVEWFEIDQEVIDLAQVIIDNYHQDLKQAKIGFIFRSEAPRANGKRTLGKAQKVSAKDKAFNNLDFIIWIAEDVWKDMGPMERRALLDHELCHCVFQDGEARMRGHDFEEFQEIVQRHGFWSKSLQYAAPVFQEALQMRLPLEFSEEVKRRAGALVALRPDVVLSTALVEE
jgi:hypothetical protein